MKTITKVEVKKPVRERVDILKEYAQKKVEAAVLADEIKALEPKVMAYLEKSGVDTLKEVYGTFSVVYRKKWTYTPELVEKEMEYDTIVKSMKQEEQVNGEAQVQELKGLSYRHYNPNEVRTGHESE